MSLEKSSFQDLSVSSLSTPEDSSLSCAESVEPCIVGPHCPFDSEPARIYAQPSVFYRGIGYCSLSEAALAILLEYFIPGFDIVPGRTFQVPLGSGRSSDFLINGVFIEYHQVRLFPSRGKLGDYSSRREFQTYLQLLKRFRRNRYRKKQLEASMKQRLAYNYYWKRRDHLNQHKVYKRYELVVTTDLENFYHLVIKRFSLVEVPEFEKFDGMFWSLVKTISAADRARVQSEEVETA